MTIYHFAIFRKNSNLPGFYINRHQVLIAGIKGKGVKPCLRESDEKKAKCREALEDNKSKKVEKLLNVARLRDYVIMSLSTCEEKEEEQEEEKEEEISIIEGRTRKRYKTREIPIYEKRAKS